MHKTIVMWREGEVEGMNGEKQSMYTYSINYKSYNN